MGADEAFAVLVSVQGAEYYVMNIAPSGINIVTPQNFTYGMLQESTLGVPIYTNSLRNDPPHGIDPRRLPGKFQVIDEALPVDTFTLKACVESAGSGGSVNAIDCQIIGDGSLGGQLYCVAGFAGGPSSCQLTIHGRQGVLAMSMTDEQFGYDAWYGQPYVDSSKPCCMHVRDAFAVRVR